MTADLERLRSVLAEWERGNFAAGAEILYPDFVLSTFVPGGTVTSMGFDQVGEHLRRHVFAQWDSYRIEVGELSELDDAHVLMKGRQIGTGQRSGIEAADDLYIVFRFAGDRVSGMYWHPERSGALELASLDEK